MNPLTLLSSAAAVAVVAYVYSQILTDGGMMLNWLFNRLEQKLPTWLFKPLIGCMYCVAGQMAFWYYLIASVGLERFIYDPFQHVFFSSLSIFLISFIHKGFQWSKKG